MSVTLQELLGLGRRELMARMEAGHPIDPRALDDTEYRGVSLGLPPLFEKLSWKTFKKVFHREPETGVLRGWNIRIQQTGRVDGPYEPQMRRGAPRTFGHYRVVPTEGFRMPRPCGAGLMIDYGTGGNGLFDPMRLLRDPIVALEAGSADLLLGWSYVDLGIFRIGTPSFFTLERGGPLGHRADPPRRA